MAAAPLRDRLREAFSRYLETPATRLLVALGVSPDALTVTGFTIAIGAACLAGAGLFLAAGLVFLAASVLDMLDGALARATDRVNAGGALLDSVTDRLSEGALLIGIGVNAALAGMSQGRLIVTVALLLSALLFSQMVSYIRARGEGLGIACKVGLMTRPERVMLLSLGLVLQGVGVDPSLLVTVGIVAGLSLTTMIQRFVHVRRQLRG